MQSSRTPPAPDAPSAVNGGVVEALVRAHRSEMLAFVRRRAGHLVDPEDVLQRAAVHALAGVGQLRDPARGRAWLFRIVRNSLADELRALGVPLAATRPEEVAAEAPEIPGETCQCALVLARTLKPEYAQILERVVLDETPVTTLAAELGTTPNNAMVRLHRARRALREELQRHCGVTSLRACLSCVCDERGCCGAHPRPKAGGVVTASLPRPGLLPRA